MPNNRASGPQLPDLRRAGGREPKVQPASDEAARAFSACRTLGHQWADVGFGDGLRVPIGEYNTVCFVSQCTRCGTQRSKWIGRYGHRGTVQYRYPDGYQRHAEERLSLEEWRRTWLVSMLGERA